MTNKIILLAQATGITIDKTGYNNAQPLGLDFGAPIWDIVKTIQQNAVAPIAIALIGLIVVILLSGDHHTRKTVALWSFIGIFLSAVLLYSVQDIAVILAQAAQATHIAK